MKPRTALLGIAAAVVATTAFAQERGRDGQLNILYWQAASILNPYLSGGTKDIEASSMVLEPLAYYDENGPWSRPWQRKFRRLPMAAFRPT